MSVTKPSVPEVLIDFELVGELVVTEDALLDGATFAITGGTGSFGSIMAKHLLDRGVSRVHIFSRDEAKQEAMRRRFADGRLRFFLGDVRDADGGRMVVPSSSDKTDQASTARSSSF